MKNNRQPKILESSLSDLISKFSKDNVIEQMEKEYSTSRSKSIPIDLIKDNHYLKKIKFPEETINRLAKNVTNNGIYTPILVTEYNGKYEIVLGRKRFYAAKACGIGEIPCIIADFREEEILLILLADARDQRETNVIEIALLCKELSRRFKYTQETLGDVSHQSRPQITNIMRLLTLPDEVIRDIELGKLSYGHAKALLTLSEEKILATLPKIYEQKLSVRDVESLVSKLKSRVNSDSLNLQKKYRSKRVDVRKKSVTFSFNDEKEVEAFLSKIS